MSAGDPFDLIGQKADEEKQTEAAKLRRRQEQDDFRWLMKSKQGRRIAWRLLSTAGVFVNPFRSGKEFVEFNCGLQAIGQTVLAEINTACPEKYQVMVKEQQDAGTERSAE